MSHCVLEQRDGKWYCINCNGLPLKEGHYKRQCPSTAVPVDAAQWFTAYYAKQNLTSPPLADILAKLERCRSANCVGLQDDVCTAMGSSPCKQRAVWFSMLTGTASCQHWLPQKGPRLENRASLIHFPRRPPPG